MADWMIFAGTTAYTVGCRVGDHMLWSPPFYNRRDAGDEFQAGNAVALLALVYNNAPPPPPQTRLHLLFLAILLKAMMAKNPSHLSAHFPNLSGLAFDIPSGEPNDEEYESTGRDHQVESDDSSAHSGEHGDNSPDYNPAHRHSGGHTTIAPVSGSLVFSPRWKGELSRPAGYSVHLHEFIAQGAHGIVEAGVLFQNGAQISEVAVKRSDDRNALMGEFSVYQNLGPSCPYVARCLGVGIYCGTTFLVTELARNRLLPQPYSRMPKSDRGAVYAALRCIHQRGWMHNDFVDHSKTLRNLLWSNDGRPVIIDFVTAQTHNCNGACSELAHLKRALQLKNHDLAIWAV
ncbi:hypothetical protein B0H14DRAFT_336079 [Mycena olivaceomarginata]|nr:hypothetical protein B0H14DRAFT_336079 [Mycena olivaceomarginata]